MKRQHGFTLVEIAIVLVIIGLLLGGILKGQELINSARVRNLADTATGIQAAYYGFIDRYRRVPGDWNTTAASQAIGITVRGGGNDNGRIDNGPPMDWTEPNSLWDHLGASGFIQGSYLTGSTLAVTTAPTTDNGLAPLNAFNNVMILGRSDDWAGAPASRLHLVMGGGIPVDVMRELDLKLDDGVPDAGSLRGTDISGSGALFGAIAERDAACVDTTNNIWDVRSDSQGCNAVYIF